MKDLKQSLNSLGGTKRSFRGNNLGGNLGGGNNFAKFMRTAASKDYAPENPKSALMSRPNLDYNVKPVDYSSNLMAAGPRGNSTSNFSFNDNDLSSYGMAPTPTFNFSSKEPMSYTQPVASNGPEFSLQGNPILPINNDNNKFMGYGLGGF